MSQLQVLRWSKASRAHLGYHVHPAAGVSVHYSHTAAAPAGLDGSRTFCLSTEKHTLQQLNGRLASYMQQVQCLAAANQRLECQIQEELDRRCPGELKELDEHLRTAYLLQEQISECLSAQAQVKLQLLNAELTAVDLKLKSEKERQQRSRVEEELSDLWLLKEELRVNQLPELQSLLNNQTQQMVELQQQHQQEMQVFLSQVSGGNAVEMQTAKSSDLIEQLDFLRQTSVVLLDRKQSESWFKTEGSMLNSPEVTFDASGDSQVDQAELEELRRTAAGLTKELTQQQTLIMQLEAYGQEQTESFALKLSVLQQTVDSLCRDLDSVLHATAKQAADHQSLLDVKNQLETEIQDYRKLLDEMTHQGVFSPHIKSTSDRVTTSPCAFRTNTTADTGSVHKGNLSRVEIQTVSRGHVVGPTPVVTPLSETVTTVQSIRVHSNHQKNLPVTSANISNITESFQKLENQKRTEQESMTINTTVQKQSSPVEDRVHAKDLQVSSVVDAQFFKTSGAVDNSSKTEIISSSAIQTEPETFTVKTKTDTNLQAEMTKTSPSAEPDAKQEPHLETIADPEEPDAAEVLSDESNSESNNLTTDEKKNASPDIPDNSDNPESKSVSTELLKLEVDEVEVVYDNSKLQSDSETAIVAADVSGLQESNRINVDSVESDKDLIVVTPDTVSTSMIDSGVALSSSDSEELLSSREADAPTSPTKPATEEECLAETPDDLKINERPRNSDRHVSPVEAKLLMNDNKIERNEKESEVPRVDQSIASSISTTDKSNSESNKLLDHPDPGSNMENALSCSLDSSNNDEFRTTDMTEILSVVSGIQDSDEEKAHPSEEDNELDVQADQEVSKSISSPEECLSEQEAEELIFQTKEEKCLTPEISMSPTETEVRQLSMTDCIFCPVGQEENIKVPDLPLCQNEPQRVLSDSDTCLSPNDEEQDEEACLSLTEANAHVKPVEKYILSTKEEGQSLSFSTDQGLTEEDRQTNITVSEWNEDCLSFESFESTEGRKLIRPTTQRSSPQVEVGGQGGRSIIADKEEQHGFGGLYRKTVRKATTEKCRDTNVMADDVKKNDTQVVNKPGDSERVFGKPASSRPSDGRVAISRAFQETQGIAGGDVQASTAGVQGRSRQGSGEWFVYGPRVGRTSSSLPKTGSKESPSAARLPASSQPETGRFGSGGSEEWIVYGSSLKHKSSQASVTKLSCRRKKESSSDDSKLATNPPDTGRFKRRGSDEWMVYVSLGRKSNLTGSENIPNTDSKDYQATNRNLATSPPATGRFGSEGSGEWRVYGGSSGRLSSAGSTEEVSVNRNRMMSPPGSYTNSGPRLCSIGSVVRRSSSVGSGGKVSSSGSGDRISSSPGSYRISSTGRYSNTGSGEWKPVYSSSVGRRSSVGSTGLPGGGRTASSQRAPSPGGRMGFSGGSGGWLNSSAATGNRVSIAGSGSNHSSAGSNDRISNRAGARTRSTSGSGRTSSSGRVISSSDWPVSSTGSGAGGHKDRISVCKMAALSISAAGRERSQERQKQRSQQQQAAGASPLVQRWLITGVGVTSTDPGGLDDIMHL